MFRTPRRWLWLGVTLLALQVQVAATAEDRLDLEAHNGRVVLLDFWASWCGPCRHSFAWMNDMQAKYGADGLTIIAVNLDNEPADATRFLAEQPHSFEVYFDRDKTMARRYDVSAMPSSFLIGRDGRIVARHLGYRVAEQPAYEAAIVAALGEAN